MKGLWLFRHGALSPNPERRLTGALDLPLSEEGRVQARQAAENFMPRIAAELRVVLCSDLSRCRETASLLLADCPQTLPVYVEPAFREISLGLWEGLRREDIRRLWPGAFEERGLDMMNFVPQGGESFRMVQRRSLHALARWRQRYPEGLFLVVTHAGVMRVLLAQYLGLPLSAVWSIPKHYASRRFLPGW